MTAQRIITTLWFDGQAEQAAELYCSIFDDARIVSVVPYPDGTDKAGEAMTVEFELLGQRYLGLNGGPQFPFTEAISLQVLCRDQAEIDRYWDALTDGGEEGACGWLKDRFGLSWQIIPEQVSRFFTGDREASARAAQAMYGMRKLDIAALEAARAAIPA
ncbi:putative 3-demethylubiquinone-9 3-methyltransferase (glyoxalase superfamily) [Solirubrobacter pauli]|uniref:Putative 3-demethylubiquinone-9 3-methyltransferase (Glyoxalase superfamily) n=1 Tax=Solirubrobacter pauli TaxID=166793 RepID=A0A660LCY9_9ACTN|nr:VOC family protein [Solirubrobacter pauli]RKQ91733.1 putative 3-demethylubiquinone-9 3-methyltransferase (glyoxalase superfamily) [Solirubrobacter pauli]